MALINKKVAIVGYGYVGQAMYNFFSDHFQTIFYDPAKEGSASIKEINECDLAVVCVPTPMSKDGSVDLSIIKETISWLKTPLILIKSTVPPGTTDQLIHESKKKIAFSPEFIGEGNYVVAWWKDKGYPHPTDMKYHDFQIFGSERRTTSQILEFFKRVLGPEARYHQTTAKTAELCKYMENSWLGTKVIFCNEFAKIAEAFNVDYDELRELWLLDGRVERMHTAVFKEAKGFGGKCLPKDINGIVKAATKAGYTPKLLKSVLQVNDELRSVKKTRPRNK
jgi:nucleotide sugar dehydrogenase